MSVPRKHHYIPAFYLRQWSAAAADRRLCEYKRVPGKIVTKRAFPENTGCKVDLYRVEGLPEPLAQLVESKFMHMVDTKAKTALDRIMSDDGTSWEPQERTAWTRFLLSLLYRNPEAVQQMNLQMASIWEAAVENLRGNYAAFRLPTDPPTFDEFLALTEPQSPQKAAAILLQDVIDNSQTGTIISRMEWTRVSVGRSDFTLLTSDRPIAMPLGLKDRDAYIALPIGPKALFVAAHDGRCAARFRAANPTQLAKRINQEVVHQARGLVWGIDASQHQFVKNRMSRVPDRILITDAQRERAVLAAAGR